ncbi:MAG TPA: energy transducer TonB, partial [Geobacteraceae bacterium]
DPKPGWMLLGSLCLHALLVLLLGNLHFFASTLPEAPTYYVDLVTMPVANPQAGSPTAPATAATPASAPAPKPSPMTTPAPAAKTTPATKKGLPESGKRPEAADAGAKALTERLAKLERETEARHQAEALAALQKKLAAGKATAGMPKGTGSEAGSDYGAYIQSRLRDALATTIAYQSKHPETSVRLFIDRNGKLTRFVIEKSSRDKVFDDAVLRAIDKAKGTFPPPPTGRDFDKLFVFSPEEVGKK